MAGHWLERWLETIADRGRELLGLNSTEQAAPDVASLCRALLEGEGEASAIALSREILARYRQMDAAGKQDFFTLLDKQFAPDPQAIRRASEAYLAKGGADELISLNRAVEPPRQELLRRLNMAPQATAQLVAMRGDLLSRLREQPQLKAVDADFKHLLASWFNRGFLQLRRIDWQSPAGILEKLISYEAVHAIQGWDDLRRRLAADRRCFAFFHPAMPDEPLIFVEVALVEGMSAEVGPLLDAGAPVSDGAGADTALFYSINNTQAGLRGISFGNFLIKQVLAELSEEYPRLRCFATLSPLPRFAATLRAGVAGTAARGFEAARIDLLLEEWAEPLLAAAQDEAGAGPQGPGEALLHLLDTAPLAHRELLGPALAQLALAYLTLASPRGGVVDPVAGFHLANGARLERINPFADLSPERMQASFGVMVNYLYEPDEVEANHEGFVCRGEVALSRNLSKARRRLEETAPLTVAESPA